jgi:hypothetical protein
LIVDTVLTNGKLQCPLAHEIHKKNGNDKAWEREKRQLQEASAWLLSVKVRPERSWITGDGTSGNMDLTNTVRELEVFHLLALPKDRNIEVFGRTTQFWESVTDKPNYHLTVDHKLCRYKHTVVNL